MADQGTGVPVSKTLSMAVGHYQAGHLQQAEAMFRQVVAAQPNNADALHCLGVIAYQTGRHDRALGLVDKAIARNKGVAAYHSSRGAVLVQLGRHDAAIASFKRAIKIEPAYPEAHSNLGNALQEAGRPDAAVAAYRRAIELRPDFAQAHSNLGQALRKLRKLDESAAAYRRAVEIDPGFVRGHNFLGHALQSLGQRDGAIAAYRRAGELKPDFAEAHTNLGNALHDVGKLDEAIAAHRHALEVRPNFAEAHSNLGHALQEAGKPNEAVASFRRAIEINPDLAEAHSNLGAMLQIVGKLDEAVAALRRAIETVPDFAQARTNLADVLLQRDEAPAALEVCDDYLERHPGNIRVLALKAFVLNDLGDRDGARYLVDFDRLLRATRVAAVPGFATVADFNAAIARHVCAHPTLTPSPPRHATRSGKHTGELLVEPKGPVAALEELIRGEVEAYLAALPEDGGHPFLATRPRRWRLTAWAVVMQSQGHQIPHIHPSGWLSGVYYVQLPGVIDASDEGRSGWIAFGRPRPDAHVSAEPEVRVIRPAEGLMLMFPSYFHHQTVPFEAAEERISIAFDVQPDP